jgi:hypothetical protein
MNRTAALIILFSLGLLLRLAFVPNPGFEADVSFWKGWGLASADKGVVWSMLNTNNNYPTPFAYTLGGMVHLYRLLGGDPYNFDDYWSNTNVRFLFVSKLPAILADLGIAAILIWIGRNPKRFGFPEEKGEKKRSFSTFFNLSSSSLFFLLAALYLFNPVSLMDGAWWGQVDSLGVILFLLSFLAVSRKRLYLAGFIFILAMMTKLQNMIYAPFLFAFIWQQYGLKQLIKAMAGATLGFVLLNLEFFLSGNRTRIISSLIDNYDYFPYMSLHAYNIWWIVSNGDGMGVSDKLLFFGRLSAKSMGLYLFIGSYLLAITQVVFPAIKQFFSKTSKEKDQHEEQSFLLPIQTERFFVGMSIVNAGFFLLLTQSHERYAFPLMVFLLFLIPFVKNTRRTIFVICYGVISVFYFYNLHTAFAVNYPHNVFQFLTGWFITAPPTMFVSLFFMVTFILFLIFFRKTITFIPFLISGGVILLMIVMGNLSYWRKQPLPLSSFTPWYSSQQFGKRVEDMPVNGGFGPKSWTWLSTQYVFYRKGIGTHANSELRYDVAGKFKEFSTDFGIDTTAGTGASAIFEIWGDNKQLFASDKMGRFDMPKHAKVNIEGINTLILITHDAGDSNRDDHTNWLNPKLYP